MPPDIRAHPMGEPTFVAAGTGPDGVESDAAMSERGAYRRDNIERRCAIARSADDRVGVCVRAMGDRAELIDAELVAARTDHRTEDGGDDSTAVSARRVHSDVDHPIGQPLPPTVCADDRAVVGQEEDRCTVGGPHGELRRRTAGDEHVALAGGDRTAIVVDAVIAVDIDDGDAVDLVEHDPSATGRSSLTLDQVGRRHLLGVHVAVDSVSGDDRDPASAELMGEERGRHPVNSLQEGRDVEVVVIVGQWIGILDIAEQFGDPSR